MANVTSFDTSRIMREISKVAPFALLTCALLSFLAVGIFSVDYYEHLFLVRFPDQARSMAVLVASIQEAVRFGLLVASIRDFTDKKPFNGWLGLLGSLALVVHDVNLANELAAIWNAENSKPYEGVLIFLILIGLLLEVRLILTVAGKEGPADQGRPGATRSREVPADYERTRSNGVHA